MNLEQEIKRLENKRNNLQTSLTEVGTALAYDPVIENIFRCIVEELIKVSREIYEAKKKVLNPSPPC